MKIERKEVDRVYGDEVRTSCPVCLKELGTRRVTVFQVDDDHIYVVHSKSCADIKYSELMDEQRAETRRVEEQKRQEILAQNDARKEQRGSWEDYVSSRRLGREDEPEARFQRLCYLVKDAEKELAEAKASLDKQIASDPVYACSTYMGPFMLAAAKHKLAGDVQAMFEHGHAPEAVLATLKRYGRWNDSNPLSRSTSLMSNLMDDCLSNVYRRAIKVLDGDDYYFSGL